jgi:hypothetical protein
VNIVLSPSKLVKYGKNAKRYADIPYYLIKQEIDPCGGDVYSLETEVGESEYNAYLAKHRGDDSW